MVTLIQDTEKGSPWENTQGPICEGNFILFAHIQVSCHQPKILGRVRISSTEIARVGTISQPLAGVYFMTLRMQLSQF